MYTRLELQSYHRHRHGPGDVRRGVLVTQNETIPTHRQNLQPASAGLHLGWTCCLPEQKAQDQIPSPGEGAPVVSIPRGTVKHLFGDIQPFTLSCFNQSTLKRETAGPEVLYLYLFSLNLQLTFFPENMLHSSLYELNSPSSVTFCLKQATQLFTTCTETGVTCSDSPKTHDCTSGFSHVQTPNCRDGTSRATPAGEFSPTPLPPCAPLGSAARHPSVVCSKGSARDAVIWLLGASPQVASPTLHPEHQFRC